MLANREFRLVCTLAVLFGGCVDGTHDGDPASEELHEIAPGVRVETLGTTTRWDISGREGHLWFRDELLERMSSESEPEIRSSYSRTLQNIDAMLGSMSDEDVEDVELRATHKQVSITPITSGGNPGHRAWAYAHRDGVGSVCVDTYARVNAWVENPSLNSAWGVGVSVSQAAQAAAAAPVDCFATAFAGAGSSSTYAESYACPSVGGGGSGGGGGGAGGGNVPIPVSCLDMGYQGECDDGGSCCNDNADCSGEMCNLY